MDIGGPAGEDPPWGPDPHSLFPQCENRLGSVKKLPALQPSKEAW